MKNRRQASVAYAGYAVCALIIALFEWQLVASGPEIYMMVGIFLFPFAGGAAIAMSFSWGIHSAILRVLGALTAAIGLFLYGDGNFILAIQLSVTSAYVVFVFLACLFGWREWWPSTS